MAVKLDIEARGTYLYFEVSGEREREQMVNIWGTVARELRALGLNRVLGVSKLTGPASTIDIYRVAEAAANDMQNAGCEKLAYVVTDKNALQSNLFAETVAVNRGLDARMFTDKDSALIWLMR